MDNTKGKAFNNFRHNCIYLTFPNGNRRMDELKKQLLYKEE